MTRGDPEPAAPTAETDDVPTAVTVDREQRTLTLEWTDGAPTVISWATLRLACPCAQCAGEFGGATLDEAAVLAAADEIDMVDATIMGHYALQPEWKSGHATGIFTWEYLRELGLAANQVSQFESEAVP
ncbi:MAG TPA: DUF971 domain-containing protein [Chloroflexota bacterium]|jgi:DUF971 family protein|nr:DUF971 domain-containing protein [Chloroflexota bacterium]